TFAKAHTQEEIESYFKEKGRNLVQFKAGLLLPEAQNDPIKKARAVKDIIGSIALIKDNIKRTLFLKEAEKALGMEEKVLYEELRRITIEKYKEENRPETEEASLLPEQDIEPVVKIIHSGTVL